MTYSSQVAIALLVQLTIFEMSQVKAFILKRNSDETFVRESIKSISIDYFFTMLQVQNKIVSWYSSVSGNLTNDFNNSLQRTLDDMEKVR